MTNINAAQQQPRRWSKTPLEVVEQLQVLLQEYRRHHNPDPAEVVEDIFTDILDRATGYCTAQVAWTVPIAPSTSESEPSLPPGWYAAAPADECALSRLLATVPVVLPASYLAFLTLSNGGEGWVGERYVSLWTAEDIHQCNGDYQIYQYLPGAVAIGTNGGDYAYLFDQREVTADPPVFDVELGSLSLGFSALNLAAPSFTALMRPG